MPSDIDPERWYSFSEAARLIPSPRGGTVTTDCLRRWQKKGRLQAASRPDTSGRSQWFVRGDELARLLEEIEPVPVPTPPAAGAAPKLRTPTQQRREQEQRRRAQEQAERYAKEHGW
jgi:hypothetical protein